MSENEPSLVVRGLLAFGKGEPGPEVWTRYETEPMLHAVVWRAALVIVELRALLREVREQVTPAHWDDNGLKWASRYQAAMGEE